MMQTADEAWAGLRRFFLRYYEYPASEGLALARRYGARRALEALNDHGRHADDCASLSIEPPACSCGLSTYRARLLREAEGGDGPEKEALDA